MKNCTKLLCGSFQVLIDKKYFQLANKKFVSYPDYSEHYTVSPLIFYLLPILSKLYLGYFTVDTDTIQRDWLVRNKCDGDIFSTVSEEMTSAWRERYNIR